MELFQTIVVDGAVFQLQMVSKTKSVVDYKAKQYEHLWGLVCEEPLLSNSRYLDAFAEISNFFWKGTSFRLIESISDFQHHYIEQFKAEKSCPADIFPFRLSDYQEFDVSVIEPPKLMGTQLAYYVYEVQTGIPYRVVCPFPYSLDNTYVHYQILPLKKLLYK